MAVTTNSSSLRASSSRLVSFEYVMKACAGVLGVLHLQRLGSDWPLALCRVVCRELRGRRRTASEVVELDCEQLSIISCTYGLVLVSRTTAVELAVPL